MIYGVQRLIWPAEWNQQGKNKKIQISDKTYNIIKTDFKFQKRKEVKVKGIGLVNTYLVL